MDRSEDWIRQARRDLNRAKLDVEHEFYMGMFHIATGRRKVRKGCVPGVK